MTGSASTRRSPVDSTTLPRPLRSTRVAMRPRSSRSSVPTPRRCAATGWPTAPVRAAHRRRGCDSTPSPVRPKSWKNAVDAATSGTPRVIDVNRWSAMTGQIRSIDRELQPMTAIEPSPTAVHGDDRHVPPPPARRCSTPHSTEFAAHGFEGASTRAIAAAAGTHQPQINYHFESKDDVVEGGGRPPLRPPRPRRARHLGEHEPGWGTTGGVRRQHPCVRPCRRRAARAEPDHGAGGDDRLRAAAVDRRTPHPSALRASSPTSGGDCETTVRSPTSTRWCSTTRSSAPHRSPT